MDIILGRRYNARLLVGDVIYGAKPSYEDPAHYSFAHGGKDETPYPVDRPTDKDGALKRLTGTSRES